MKTTIVTSLALLLIAGVGYSQVNFGPKVDFPTGASPFTATIADLNADGKPDLAVSNYAGHSVSLLLNQTSRGATAASFRSALGLPLGNFGLRVLAQDLNADGQPDLAVCNGTPPTPGCGLASVFLNTTIPGDATVTFGTRYDFPVGSNPIDLTVADFNGDGLPDLAVVNQNVAGCQGFSVSVLLNATLPGNSTPIFDTVAVLPADFSPVSIAAQDLNADGRPDLIVGIRGDRSSSLAVFLNATPMGSGSASFLPPVFLGTGAGGGSTFVSVATADINGDGRPDILAANSATGALSVFLNTTTAGATTPSFLPRVDFAAGSIFDSPALAVADVNSDGKPDAVVVNGTANTVSVFLNTTASGASTPTFALPPATFPTGSFPVSVAVGDLNGDNAPDLVTVNSGDNSVSVLLNIPNGFLDLPLSALCGSVACTPLTADVSAVLDHSVDHSAPVDQWYNCNLQKNCDGVVLAFDGQEGNLVFGQNCAPPGYMNRDHLPFVFAGLHYVGSSCKGDHRSPLLFLNYDGHSGYDFPYGGSIIVAAADGVLEVPTVDVINNFAGSSPHNKYNTLRIRHTNGYETWYLHALEGSECLGFLGRSCKANSPDRPRPGDSVEVKAGQPIAVVGSTGASSPHLHFEVRLGPNQVVDPFGCATQVQVLDPAACLGKLWKN